MEQSLSRTEEMKYLRSQKQWSLQEIATKYGISRERVRQLIGNTGTGVVKQRRVSLYLKFKHLTNKALGNLLGIKAHSVTQKYRNGERHEIEGGLVRIGVEAEIAVSKKLASIGIKNTLMPHHHPFDILLDDGKRIDVKGGNARKKSKTRSPLYTFRTDKREKGNYCDFYILFLLDTKDVFVVPFDSAKNSLIGFCYPISAKSKKSKWHKFHNRFDLLKG